MSLEKEIMSSLKEAMKAKDKIALESLRAVKSALLLAKTDGSAGDFTEADEIKLLQKLVKQRKEAAEQFEAQDRKEMAEKELSQAEVIMKFLPEQLSEEQIKEKIQGIIGDLDVSSPKEMGKVIGKANQVLAGKAEGRLIAKITKELLI